MVYGSGCVFFSIRCTILIVDGQIRSSVAKKKDVAAVCETLIPQTFFLFFVLLSFDRGRRSFFRIIWGKIPLIRDQILWRNSASDLVSRLDVILSNRAELL